MIWFHFSDFVFLQDVPFTFNGIDFGMEDKAWVMPVAGKITGLAARLYTNTLTQTCQVHVMVNNAPLVSLPIPPAQEGTVSVPTPLSVNVPLGASVHFQFEAPPGTEGQIFMTAVAGLQPQ